MNSFLSSLSEPTYRQTARKRAEVSRRGKFLPALQASIAACDDQVDEGKGTLHVQEEQQATQGYLHPVQVPYMVYLTWCTE